MCKTDLINLAKHRGIRVTTKDTVASLRGKIAADSLENPPEYIVKIVQRRIRRGLKYWKTGRVNKCARVHTKLYQFLTVRYGENANVVLGNIL